VFLGMTLTMLSGILIAAHFLRSGMLPVVLIGLAFPFLLLYKKPWVNRIVQVLLILSAGIWLLTLLLIAAQRQAAGEPWVRMAVILGSVVLLNVAAAVAVNPKKPVSQGAEGGKSAA